MAPKWNRITSMVIAKLCSGDYDFEGNNRAASTQSQMYAIPVSDPANDITPVSGPDSATANASAFTSSSASTSITESTVSPSEESIKLPKLTNADKDKVMAVYDRLDKSKMSRFSTGTYVEEKMLECALENDHENLAHSLILNVKDNDWYNESQLFRKLSAVLKAIFAGRILMESTALKLGNDST